MPSIEHYKPAPDGWVAAEIEPNKHSGHWPGWIPAGDGPNDKWHREAFYHTCDYLSDEAVEILVGPKIEGNPYGLKVHHLWKHGGTTFKDFNDGIKTDNALREFDKLKTWLQNNVIVEGIVWHHQDGRMVKIKRKDFGLPWPPV